MTPAPTAIIVNAIFGTNYTSATYSNPEGDVFIESAYAGFAYLQPGGDGLLTILHEIGHALGLKHPFDELVCVEARTRSRARRP